jgi:hypothetical protein
MVSSYELTFFQNQRGGVMKIRNRKRIISVTVLLFVCFYSTNFATASELTARAVMEKVDARYTGDTEIKESMMVLIDRKGNQRVRHTKGYRKEFGKDTKSLSIFLSPADVKNTTFLSYIWDDATKEDDSWLYLPGLRKVKRIASSDKSGAFMGSDFTYADTEGVDVDNYQYRFIKTKEKIDGHDLWLIESIPKKEIKKKVIKETGVLKSHQWIRKDIFMVIKAKFWVKKGKKIKYLTVHDIENIDEIWTAKKVQMVVTKKGKKEHATILQLKSIRYNQPIEDNEFTIQRMERGE